MIKGKCKACRKTFEGKNENILTKMFSRHTDKHHKLKLRNKGVIMKITKEN